MIVIEHTFEKAFSTNKNISGLELPLTDFSNLPMPKNMICTDFVGSKLRKSDLKGCNIEGANFTGADLEDADLSGVNARWASFRRAKLKHVNLEGADLRGANLQDTNMTGVVGLPSYLTVDQVRGAFSVFNAALFHTR